MPLQINYEPDDICVVRATGLLRQSEFTAEQKILGGKMDTGAKPRILAILEDFQGWERGKDWDDLDYLFAHSNDVAKIAIVAEPRWEAQALAFAGAGMRRAPVKVFPPGEVEQARAWIKS
jgi:hypothetical protein